MHVKLYTILLDEIQSYNNVHFFFIFLFFVPIIFYLLDYAHELGIICISKFRTLEEYFCKKVTY